MPSQREGVTLCSPSGNMIAFVTLHESVIRRRPGTSARMSPNYQS